MVVEGTRLADAVEGPWFKCRLFPEETPEGEGARGGRRMLSKMPHVIVGVKDLNHDPIQVGDITTGKMIEVDAGVIGRARWQITSDPQPLVPKRKPLGYWFTVRKVEVAS